VFDSNASRTMRKAARSVSIVPWGQEVSTPVEETCPFQGHIPFDDAASRLLSGAGLGSASWLPPTSTLEP
jgi:hypothetical protein